MADTTPTLAGFQAYCRAEGFTSDVIPDNDPGFDIAFSVAMEWVPCQLQSVGAVIYTYTVYQWGLSVLIAWQPDQPGQTFFATLRDKYRTLNFVAGVIASASDNGTAKALQIGSALSNLGLADLQRLTDPWGQRAIATLMSMGGLWGLT